MCLSELPVSIAGASSDSESRMEGSYLRLHKLSIRPFLVFDSRISGHFKGFLCIFLWFRGVFTAELLRKENTHLHAAKHRQGASSVLLQYLISVRQTSFWKELMFLSIQFRFTVQHFLHSNTLGKFVNCIFLFSFYLYSWIKRRNYWFVLQSFFPLAVNLPQYFLLLVCCMSCISLLISGWNCELFAWRTLTLHSMDGSIGGTCC